MPEATLMQSLAPQSTHSLWLLQIQVICLLSKSFIYRMHLNFCRTKLSRFANLLNIWRFYFRGCWEQINMVDHLVLGKLCD